MAEHHQQQQQQQQQHQMMNMGHMGGAPGGAMGHMVPPGMGGPMGMGHPHMAQMGGMHQVRTLSYVRLKLL